jgi:hypothetical protein
MSYHYNYDQKSTFNQDNACNYSILKNTTNYSCDQPCLCRFDEERSAKDRMYYNWFVLQKPMNLPAPGQMLPEPQKMNCSEK